MTQVRKKRKIKKRYVLLIGLVLLLFVLSLPELLYQNEGKSKAKGTVGNGSLENPYLIPYFGENYSYFSPLSYFVLNDAYLHHKTYQTILDAYQTCEQTCPNVDFKLMECSNKDGGKMLIHRTHQNGLSADFVVPKKRGNSPTKWLDYLGMWHYLLEFDDSGRFALHSNTQIDFETMGKHILALDDVARKNGMRIKKVIFKINLKDDFYNTPSGKKVKARGIYFARALTPFLDMVHDDHYHVDFELL